MALPVCSQTVLQTAVIQGGCGACIMGGPACARGDQGLDPASGRFPVQAQPHPPFLSSLAYHNKGKKPELYLATTGVVIYTQGSIEVKLQ